jgi:hypothetical protein
VKTDWCVHGKLSSNITTKRNPHRYPAYDSYLGGAVCPLAARDTRTAAYGSAYCIVRLIRGRFGSPVAAGANELDTPPNPVGAGSENAPYASRDGRDAAACVSYPLLRGALLEYAVVLGAAVVVVAPDQRLESAKGELAAVGSS